MNLRLIVHSYSLDIFGYFQSERYSQKIEKALSTLYKFYMAYPEYRHIETKNHMYRIILDAHLIIYRITDERIEVLDIVRAASSIGKIHRVRKIHL